MAKRKKKRPKYRSKSRGERKIIVVLNSYKLKYDYDKSFPDLLNSSGNKMRFDFVVYLKDKIFVIEFDGEQHYRPVSFSNSLNAEKAFEKIKASDKMKDDFCKLKNIDLLRIPYYKINDIENVIKKFLVKQDKEKYGISKEAQDRIDFFKN